ncbi:hypothetical protein WMY93_016929 [Mugilogobius chulae]|uniref:Lens fiber membrane intrinsic protein n=1 Tax=Mugilogobius chulae TaxID=88201 RepID=A0AAW0NXS3_9GOBI
MYSFMGGGLFCAGVGNILLIVSTATDYWMQYRQSSNYMHQGLWRYCTPGKCFPHNDSIAHLDATRALMILSLLACFIGIIIGIMAFIHYSSFDRFDKTFAAGILFFISCFFVFLAMAVYTGVTINYYGKRYGNWRFSWSYIIGWVSVVLTFFQVYFTCVPIGCMNAPGAGTHIRQVRSSSTTKPWIQLNTSRPFPTSWKHSDHSLSVINKKNINKL